MFVLFLFILVGLFVCPVKNITLAESLPYILGSSCEFYTQLVDIFIYGMRLDLRIYLISYNRLRSKTLFSQKFQSLVQLEVSHMFRHKLILIGTVKCHLSFNLNYSIELIRILYALNVDYLLTFKGLGMRIFTFSLLCWSRVHFSFNISLKGSPKLPPFKSNFSFTTDFCPSLASDYPVNLVIGASHSPQ